MNRIKVNTKFPFPLELDVSKYYPEPKEKPEMYQLRAVIIHQGGAHGGHYHAYMRDELGEGVWDLELPSEFAA